MVAHELEHLSRELLADGTARTPRAAQRLARRLLPRLVRYAQEWNRAVAVAALNTRGFSLAPAPSTKESC